MSAQRIVRQFGGLLLLGASSLIAQQAGAQQSKTSRDAYRSSYQVWREAEPDLERDAASTTGGALAGRAAHAATEAAGYSAARGAFLRQLTEDQSQNVLWLQDAAPFTLADFAPSKDLQQLVGAEAAIVRTTIATFAADTDRGIQQLRQALERERTALAALDASITERQKAQDKAAQTGTGFEPARVKALTEYQVRTGALSPSAALVDREAAAWATYYPALASGNQAPAAAPTISGAAVRTPAAPVSAGLSTPVPTPANTSPAPRAGTPPLPLTRYTGVWVYPTVNGRFFRAEPEFVDFTVHEENGHVTGSFYGRFKFPPGYTGDPLLRFDFSGDFQATPRQTFPLETADGAKGTIELIPGNAFNLLEINFQTDLTPGKIRAADLVLLKK